MSDYCPHGVGMKYPCTQCKDAELADAKARIAELEARAHSSAVAWEKAATELAIALPRALRAEDRAELAEEQLVEAYAGANLLAADVIRFRDRQLAAEARAERSEARVAELDRDIAAKAHNLTYLNARAERAETERDALLYNADSQYCAGMSAGFELGSNDDRAELSRIITQRWMEIADAKASAALAPSPAERED